MDRRIRAASSFLLALVAAPLTGCGLLGGASPPPPRLDGKVLHGRYLDPDGRFSLRLPWSASRGKLQAIVETPWIGQILIPGSWGGSIEVTWEPLPLAIDLEGEEGLRRLHDEQRQRALDAATAQVPEASLSHHERIGQGKDAMDLFALKVPGGSPAYRQKWFFGRDHLDLHLLVLRFRKDDLSFMVSRAFSPGLFWMGGNDGENNEQAQLPAAIAKQRETILEFPDRVSLDDPLLEHIRAALGKEER